MIKTPARRKPTLLLTNDDGMHAPGIRVLYEQLTGDATVTVVAPEREQSGVGHAFTFNAPIHFEKTDRDHVPPGYIVSGTPVDCVKFAVSHIMKKHPDIIVSGLNLGENSGLSAFYSGTVAAAREGAFWDIPSIAFSLCIEGKEHLNAYAAMAPAIMRQLVCADGKKKRRRGTRVYYNVNFPACKPSKVRGIRVTRQSRAFFDDRYERMEVATHRTGEGYMIIGEKIDIEKSNDYDSRALMNGYITITPLNFDATAGEGIAALRGVINKDRIEHKAAPNG
jgi:5'-nucleotidase